MTRNVQIAYGVMLRLCKAAQIYDYCPVACHNCPLLTQDAHKWIVDMVDLIERAGEQCKDDLNSTPALDCILN